VPPFIVRALVVAALVALPGRAASAQDPDPVRLTVDLGFVSTSGNTACSFGKMTLSSGTSRYGRYRYATSYRTACGAERTCTWCSGVAASPAVNLYQKPVCTRSGGSVVPQLPLGSSSSGRVW